MKVSFSSEFVKHFDKRIKSNPKFLNQFNRKYKLFVNDRCNPLLGDHALKGTKEGYRAFSITGDIRVIYKVIEAKKMELRFYDIGTHNQVYK